MIDQPIHLIIPVVIDMFRFLDLLKSKKMVRNSLKLLERLDQAILEVIDNLDKDNKPPLLDRYFDKRSKLQKILR